MKFIFEQIETGGDRNFGYLIGERDAGEAARTEYASLQKLLELPPETTVWPGHNYGCRPSSTLALEKATNPFLLCNSIEEFLEMKREWPTYKKRMGLL